MADLSISAPHGRTLPSSQHRWIRPHLLAKESLASSTSYHITTPLIHIEVVARGTSLRAFLRDLSYLILQFLPHFPSLLSSYESMTPLSLVLPLLLLLLPHLPSSQCQFARYTAAPVNWYTFDTEPRYTRYQNLTDFTWTAGRSPHTGNALFNGNSSRIDLLTFPDDNGKTLQRTLPQTLSFEFWASFSQLGFWMRLFDCGAGTAADNMFVSAVGTSTDLHAAFLTNSVSESVTAPRAIHPNSWQHIVVTIAKRFMQNNNQLAAISIYVDGRLMANQSTTAVLPRQVERRNCWLGKSNWMGDANFVGWIDDFFLYDYPLSPEAVLAHYVLPRPPVYELTFSTDPRSIYPGYPASYFTYQWTGVDERDSSNITQYHDGHLRLIGNSYIDLAAPDLDPASIGAAPIPLLGGGSGGEGTLPGGLTIEILFKADTVETWAKVMDFGNGERKDNIILGYEGDSDTLRLEQYIDGVQWTMPCIEHVVLHQWYHVVVVFSRARWNRPDERGNATCYVNGHSTFNRSNIPMPLPVVRNTAYIGKSHWIEDQYFDLLLDTFRVFDYALLAPEVLGLYKATHEPLPTIPDPTLDHAYHTSPVASYKFLTAPSGLQRQLGSNFQWTRGEYLSTDYPHIGQALFRGVDDYVTLENYASDEGGQLPVLGGSVSFETWVRFDTTGNWNRVFDLGGVMGYLDNNILLTSFAGTDTLLFEIYSGALSERVSVPSAIVVGQWMHIIAVAEQRAVNDSSSASSAVLRLYINGVYMNGQFGYAPQSVYRPSAYIAKSNWPDDAPFRGVIDSLYVYDRALAYEEVGAHYISFKPPVFELAFARDPLPWLGLSPTDPALTYSWEAFDPADQATNATLYHNGHLVLTGDSWVNLSTAVGPTSVGTTVPLVLFGRGNSSSGSAWGTAFIGWTVELTVKILTQEDGVKIFDFGNGERADNVGIGYFNSQNSLYIHVYNGAEGESFPILTNVIRGLWYHIVVTMVPTTAGKGTFAAFIDGQFGNSDSDHFYPRAIARHNCYLGKSNWREGYFDMKLDTFRIYDYVLTAEQISQLYSLTTSELVGVARPLYDTAPVAQYSFDNAPSVDELSGGTEFDWRQGEGSHVGIAHFNGVDQYVNLMTYPDDRGIAFPSLFGNTSISFEVWVKFEQFRDYSRVFDFGSGPNRDNVLLANQAASANLAFHVYPGSDGASSQINTPTPQWQNNTWQHVVVVVEDVSRFSGSAVRASTSAARYYVYLNGTLVANMSGYLPARVQRVFSYLAKSSWNNALFTGSIDSFYYYNYALSAEQVNVRFLLPRFPIFDLSFSNDPRLQLPQYGPQTYSWAEFDPRDNYANNSLYHGGHLVLTGSRTPHSYVNLSTPIGPSSVGVVLPRIGGESQGTGGTIPGWSWELIVKVNSQESWAKLLDWGNGPGQDNVVFGYNANSRQLEFEVWNNAVSNTEWRFPLIPQSVLGEWYHIVVVAVPQSMATYTALYYGYVDGVLANSDRGVLPRSVPRRSALLGRSNWEANGDGMFAANVDAIRVYDYALTLRQVASLYALANGPGGAPRPRVSTSSSSSSSSTAPRRVSSSSTSTRRPSRPCDPLYTTGEGYEPYCECAWGGVWPDRCFCPNPDDGDYPMDCPDADASMQSSSTGVAVAAGSGGMSTATVAAVIFAVIAVLAIAMFVYYKYFRTPATSDILGLGGHGTAEGKTGLLASTNGHDGVNGSGRGDTHGSSGGGTGSTSSAPTGLDYYLAPSTAAVDGASHGTEGKPSL